MAGGPGLKIRRVASSAEGYRINKKNNLWAFPQRLKKHLNIVLDHGDQNRPIVCPHAWWGLGDGRVVFKEDLRGVSRCRSD